MSYGIQSFRSDFLNQYTYSMEFQKNLQEDIIEPLSKFLDDQYQYSKKLNSDMKRLDKEYKEAVDKLDRV